MVPHFLSVVTRLGGDKELPELPHADQPARHGRRGTPARRPRSRCRRADTRSGRRRESAAVACRCPRRRAPAVRADPAVFVVRRPGPAGPLPDRGAPDSRPGRRLYRSARAERGAGHRGERPAQRVHDAASRVRVTVGAVAFHRRRYRHHADPADGAPGRPPRRGLVAALHRTAPRQPAVPR